MTRLSPHVHRSVLQANECRLAAIKAGPDAALVEAMCAAAYGVWSPMTGEVRAWAAAHADDADTIRVGMHAALLAAREHTVAKRAASA